MRIAITRLADLLRKALEAVPDLVIRPRALALGLQGVHLREYIKLDRRWIRESGTRTVLDVGANTGQFASAIASVLPDAMVYAFEPLPDCYEALEHRMKRLGSRCKTFQLAIGEADGPVMFHRSGFSESSSVLPMSELHKRAFPWTAEISPVQVDMRRLDTAVSRLPLIPDVLLKIDVQGYENHVLRGASETLAQVKYVITEASFETLYQGQGSVAETFALLTPYGLRFKGVLEQLACPMDDRILQADLLFVRDGTPGGGACEGA